MCYPSDTDQQITPEDSNPLNSITDTSVCRIESIYSELGMDKDKHRSRSSNSGIVVGMQSAFLETDSEEEEVNDYTIELNENCQTESQAETADDSFESLVVVHPDSPSELHSAEPS